MDPNLSLDTAGPGPEADIIMDVNANNLFQTLMDQIQAPADLPAMDDVVWLMKAQIPFLAAIAILSIFLADQFEESESEAQSRTEGGVKVKEKAGMRTLSPSSATKPMFLIGQFLTAAFRLFTSLLSSSSSSSKKGLLDTLVGFYFKRIVQFQRLTTCSHRREHHCPVYSSSSSVNSSEELESSSNSSEETDDHDVDDIAVIDQHSVKTLYSIRQAFNKIGMGQHDATCHKWHNFLLKASKSSKDQDRLVSGITYAPRRDNILHEWNIADKNNVVAASAPLSSSVNANHDWSMCDHGKDHPIKVHLTCPSSLFSNEKKKGDLFEVNKSSRNKNQLTFHPCDLNELNLIHGNDDTTNNNNIPIVIYFHGGGFIAGSPRENGFSSLLTQATMEHQSSSSATTKSSSPPRAILLSVEYRLAPECPFPGAIIDCLSATQHILETFPHNPIHLAGFSAGGNAATVVGFECVRMYPNRIKSMALIQPALNPRCDTVSFAQNGPSSVITSNCARWGWGAYLQLQTADDDDDDDSNNDISNSSKSYIDALMQHPLFRLGKVGTINPLLRLVWPQVNIPIQELKHLIQQDHTTDKGATATSSAPRIIVCTASADPLRDEGLALVESLRDGGVTIANDNDHDIVTSLDMCGDHAISLLLDSKWKKKFVTQLGACLWPDE